MQHSHQFLDAPAAVADYLIAVADYLIVVPDLVLLPELYQHHLDPSQLQV